MSLPRRGRQAAGSAQHDRHLRDVFDRAAFPWASPRSLRRTVATLMDEVGLPLALTADQLGHSTPAMTARFYLGARGTCRAAAVL
jgi:integrase